MIRGRLPSVTVLLWGALLFLGIHPALLVYAQAVEFKETFDTNSLAWRTTNSGGIFAEVSDGKLTVQMGKAAKEVVWFTYPKFETAPKVAAAYEYTFKVSGGACDKPGSCFLAVVYNIGSTPKQNMLMYYIAPERRLAYSVNDGKHNATRAASSDLPDVFSGGTFISTLRVTRDEVIWTMGNQRVIRFDGPNDFNGTIGFGIARFSNQPVNMKLSFDDVTIRAIGSDAALKAAPTAVPLAASAGDNLKNGAALYWEKRDARGALQSFSGAIAADPTLADAYAWRAYLNLVTSDTKLEPSVEGDIKKAFSLDPDNALAYAVRSRLNYVHKKAEKAAFEDAERALALAPTSPEVNSWLASIYSLAKDYQKALDVLVAMKPFPSYARLYNQRGIVHSNLKNDDGAYADYTQAITLDPTWAAPYSNRANVYLRRGDLAKSLTDLLQAGRLQPGVGVGVARSLLITHFLPQEKDFATTRPPLKIVPLREAVRYDKTNVPLWVEEIDSCYAVALDKGRFTAAQRYATSDTAKFYIHSAGFLFDTAADAQAALDKIRAKVRQCIRGTSGRIIEGGNDGDQAMFFNGMTFRTIGFFQTYAQVVRVDNKLFTFSVNNEDLMAKGDWITQDQLEWYFKVFVERLQSGLKALAK